jgi:hypothetical protein
LTFRPSLGMVPGMNLQGFPGGGADNVTQHQK